MRDVFPWENWEKQPCFLRPPEGEAAPQQFGEFGMKNESLSQTPPVAAAGSAPELLHQTRNENGATGDLKSAVSIVKITLRKLRWPHLLLKSKLLSPREPEMDKDRIKNSGCF